MNTTKNFIVFEGIDGSGKGTQIELLKKYYNSIGNENVVFTFEHTRNTKWSDKIEDILYKRVPQIPMKDLQLLFMLDRRDHIRDVIIPALKEGKIVFSDRYFLSTLVYGSLDGSLHWKTLLSYHKQIIGEDFLLPDKTIFIDVSSDVAMARINKSRKNTTVFETREKLNKINKSYLNIGRHFDGFEKINGDNDANIIATEIREIIKNYL